MLKFSADLKVNRPVEKVFAWLGGWDFEPDGTGTRLHWNGQLTMRGFARILEPLIGKQMRAQIDRQFAQLPYLIEGEIPE